MRKLRMISNKSKQRERFHEQLRPFKDSVFIKTTITILVVVSFLLLPKVGFLSLGAEGFDPMRNFVFPFCHANVFHLLCNVLCLWQMCGLKKYIMPAFIIQHLCSFLPELTPNIMGMSGLLFAIIGLKCGYANIGTKMIKTLAPFFIVTFFLPNVAFLFHLYCLLYSYAAGVAYYDYCLWKNLRL